MVERAELSLVKRGNFLYVRFWDEQERRYTTARSTKKTNRDLSAIEAQNMLNEGGYRKLSGDPFSVDFLVDHWKSTPKKLSLSYREDNIYYGRDPTVGVDRAEEENRERGILMIDQVEKMLALHMQLRYRAVLALAALAGLRKGEVRGVVVERRGS